VSPDDSLGGGSRRRLLLLSGVLLLLAAVAVGTAHFYWTGLRSGVAQVREAVNVAEAEQQRLMERLRAAQAALAERAAVAPPTPADTPAAEPQATGSPAGTRTVTGAVIPTPAAALTSLIPMLSPPERARLAAWIRSLERSAARLPPAPGRGGAAPARQLLRDQLAIAAAAAAAGDLALLDAALFAAQRLAEKPPGSRAGVLAAQLRELRAGLREPPGAPGAGASGPVQPLAPRVGVPTR
jgi:hypothetical protein